LTDTVERLLRGGKDMIEVPHSISKFDAKFWRKKLGELGYPLKATELDITILRGQKALPSDLEPSNVLRLYFDDYVEIALIEFDSSVKLRRSVCTRATRSWKENRLIKPMLVFTNEVESFAVIVPGKGIGGEAKVLGLSDRLYRTDLEVLESIRFPGKAEELSKEYDVEFFPYEKVRNEFFEGYRDLYERVEKAVRHDLKAESTSYAQRFLGRLMFLYFLQRKGWLKQDRRFIDTIKDFRELNRVFYESLNQEGTPGIPFLNGSLFEREEYMTARMESCLYGKMDELFKEARRFFNEYNFTVDETSPLEVEVSIDPALIGTVFENMLPEYERGSKGTFYTPRGESSFICRRALTNYLGHPDEISADGKIFTDGLTKYIEDLSEARSEKEIREFREKLLSIRVLDPAVGSGGFLLVMMQEIIELIQKAEAIVGWKSDIELHKKRILPNLYGFDIEPEAIEIARLRLWLSLIIDQKEPEPLPNLDMNIITIRDSLAMAPQMKLDLYTKYEELRNRAVEVRARYLNEHDGNRKNVLKKEHQKLLREIEEKTGVDPGVIENFLSVPADIVVMNPPYVKQLSIPKKQKDYYVARYGLDKKSDLFAYFLVRVLSLLSEKGIASVIASDKWLETGYGVTLQRRLKDFLVGIYGQKERTFAAEINTAIVVYGKERRSSPVTFTYLESYSGQSVRRTIKTQRDRLKPGKWFYLRAPNIFVDRVLPKLDHKLWEFTDIKRGFTTGASDFFYMKDISQLYEGDYLANSKMFEDLGIAARTEEELGRKGLVYVENEGGKRFVVNREDLVPIVRSPKEVEKYNITKLDTLCLYTSSPGKLTADYIAWGEKQTVEVKGKNKTITGYHRLETTKNRKPWFKLADIEAGNIFLPKSLMDRISIPYSDEPALCGDRFYVLRPKTKSVQLEPLWSYLNSVVFFIMVELYCRRLGGGASDVMVEDYHIMPVPDIEKLKIPSLLGPKFLNRKPLIYFDEVKQKDRRALDIAVLQALGFENHEQMLPGLYAAFIEVVEDRLVKAGRSSQEETGD
jgi:type II restriction/modification system DNA methylase subunit YeeA